ncbi:MAG: hypothetical protein ACYTG7_22080 [Planctomycetota bacterium]|jgi:hypothetical protein
MTWIKASFVLFVLFLPCACGMGWQYMEVEKVTYSDLFRLTTHIIDSSGFVIDDANMHTGEIITRWDYSAIAERGRFPLRRRAEAEIDPVGERTFSVGLRIKQQALWEGISSEDLDKQTGWEPHGFDKSGSRRILTKISLFVKDFEPSDDFYERYKRLDKRKEEVPDVLEYGSGDADNKDRD